jgi:hypothetical protein
LEWKEFKVGTSSLRANWTNQDCFPFETVSHVAHILPSLSILEEERIRAGLVFDESKLNKQRILVSWVSPNDWASGFRYGTVRFTFDWRALIDGLYIYWVESIAYGIPACRILLTSQEHNNFEVYDPKRKDGPWWYDESTGDHYYNAKHCLEFMIESDLPIAKGVKIDFVKHHYCWCSIHRTSPRRCSELGMIDSIAASHFLAGTVSRKIPVPYDLFKKSPDWPSQPPAPICLGFSVLWTRLNCYNTNYTGHIKHSDEAALPLARAILNAYFLDMEKDVEIFKALFSSKDDLANSVAQVVGEHLGMKQWEQLLQN